MYPRVAMGPLLTVVTVLQVLHSAMGTGILPGLSYLPPRPDNNLFEASRPSERPSVPAPSFPPPPPPPSQPFPRPPTVVIPFPDDTPSFQTSPGSGVIPFPPSLGALVNPGTFDLLPPYTGCPEACTKIFIPLCGTDGVTYNNECLLDIAICKGSSSGLTLSVAFEGTCDSVSVPDASPLFESVDIRGTSPSFSSSSLSTCDMQCTKIFSPVCGDDGNSYNSPCLLEVASCEAVNSGGPSITVYDVGQCVPSDTAHFIAAMSPNTAFGSGGAQFDSQQDPSTLTSSFSPQSPCPEACTKIFTPVCGSDDQTYNNECSLNVAACKSRSAGVDVLFKAFEGPCVAALPRGPVCDKACDKTFLQVCGSDGETYNNECLLNLADCLSPFASIIYAKDGPCEIKSAAGLSSDPRPMISTEPRPNIDTGAFQSPNAAIEQEYLPPV